MNVDILYKKMRIGFIDSISDENSEELLEKIKRKIIENRNVSGDNLCLDEILVPYFSDPLSIVQKETMKKLKEKLNSNGITLYETSIKDCISSSNHIQYTIVVSPNIRRRIQKKQIKKWREF